VEPQPDQVAVNQGLLFSGNSDLYRAEVLQGRPLKYPNWGLGDAFGALLAGTVIGAFAGVIMMVAGVDSMHGWALIGTLTLPWLAYVLYPMFATKYKGNVLRIDLGLSLTRPQLRLAIVGGLCSLAAAGLAALLSTKLWGPITSTAGEAGLHEHGLVAIVFGLLVMTAGPLVEEIVFRGLLLGSLLKREMAPFLALAVSAGVFSLAHFEPKRFLILFAAGLVMGEVRRRTGSTAASAISHMINNAPAALALMFGAFN